MKKLFFYGNIHVDDLSIGITKKVFSQIDTLKNLGFEVYYTGYLKNGVAIFNSNDELVKKNIYKNINKKINNYLRRWHLLSISNEFIKNSKITFDYSYLRFHFFDKYYLDLLKSLKKAGSKTIVEAHSYPYRSIKQINYLPIYIFDILYEPFSRKYIDLVAAISNHNNIWGCKTVQIDNAINLEEVKLINRTILKKDKTIRLISVSNERYYHGYEKLVKGLHKYYLNGGNREIEIHFVGEFRKKTKKLVEELNLNNRIIFHGKKYGEELEKIYKKMDLGIGALSSKAGSEYGSAIKTKEYFAKGLPFINGMKEYAFDDSYPYVKRFNLNDEIIDFNQVVKFYDFIKNSNDDYPKKMRQFAKENYTWEGQFNKIFNLLD